MQSEEEIIKMGYVIQKHLEEKNLKVVKPKDLMPLLIEKGFFPQDHRAGLPLRDLLRDLDRNNKLYLLPQVAVNLKPFQLEREIQNLIEGNTEELFQLELIHSEFTVGKYRVDSLCFDPETGGFVIIEYKKGNSYSVIDQGYTYLQLLLNNKSDFILALSQKRNRIFRQEDIDWSQSRIIFISPGFNSYQRDSVNFKNVPFELYEIKRFENECFLLNKIETTSKERIDSLSNTQASSVIRDVSKEVTVIDEDNHVSKMSEVFSKKWELLREQLLEMEDVELEAKKQYITAQD